MRRAIIGFHQDEHDDWVAELDCFHAQHVRHDPPLWPRPWVMTASGRSEHLGSILDCPYCDRAEMPEGLHRTRTAGPFDADTLPPGLRAPHLVAKGTWGCLRVLNGAVRFLMATTPELAIELRAGSEQAIPPGVTHSLTLRGPALISIDFYAVAHP